VNILGVGIATLDIVNYVSGYPLEDSEVRAESQRKSFGGNASNSLTVLHRLGHGCSWAGMLTDDSASTFVRRGMAEEGIDLQYCTEVQEAGLPTSYITLNIENGSRSIVHFRNLPEYSSAAFKRIKIEDFDWIHFEGRNIPELKKMMNFLIENNFHHFSLETEKHRQGIEELFHMPALLLFSREYVRNSHKGVKDFFNDLRQKDISAPLYCAWGKSGGWAMDRDCKLFQEPAWNPEKVVDTIGAGDAFNSGVIDATINKLSVDRVLAFACKIAGYKCGLHGFKGIEKVTAL
jgi:ketohexokinase